MRLIKRQVFFGVQEMQHIQKYVVGLCVMLVRTNVKMCDGVIGRMKYEMVEVWLYIVYMKK